MSDSVIPLTVAHQFPLFMGFSRKGYRSGLPFSSPGYLSDGGIESRSPALQADSLSSKPPGKPIWCFIFLLFFLIVVVVFKLLSHVQFFAIPWTVALISEAKQGRAWLVLGWETAWEYRVL